MSASDATTCPTSRQRNTQATREKIFLAARQIVSEQGADALTTKRICEQAGVSNGTFFYHFKTKSELLSYFLQEGFDAYYSAHAPKLRTPSSANEAQQQAIASFLVYADYCLETGVEFLKSYYVGSNAALDTRPDRLGRPLLNGQMEDVARCLSALMEEAAAQQLARDCCTVVKGCVFEWCVADGQTDLRKQIQRMLGAFLAGVWSTQAAL